MFQSICQNDSINFGGEFISVAGTYYDTVITSTACDSLYPLNLLVDSSQNFKITSVVCDEFITQLGDTIFKAGIYYDTLSTINGCESIIIYDDDMKIQYL